MAVTEQIKEFEEKVIAIDRVARVQKGGRRFRFRATVVVGDGRGRVGVGVGKGSEVMTSIAKAVAKAKRNMIAIPLRENTIPHEIKVSFSGAQVFLKPASPGTGVIAGGAVRNVVEAAGINDILTKSLGSTNKVNNAYATMMALSQLRAIGSKSQTKPASGDNTEKSSTKPKPQATAKQSPSARKTKPKQAEKK